MLGSQVQSVKVVELEKTHGANKNTTRIHQMLFFGVRLSGKQFHPKPFL